MDSKNAGFQLKYDRVHKRSNGKVGIEEDGGVDVLVENESEIAAAAAQVEGRCQWLDRSWRDRSLPRAAMTRLRAAMTRLRAARTRLRAAMTLLRAAWRLGRQAHPEYVDGHATSNQTCRGSRIRNVKIRNNDNICNIDFDQSDTIHRNCLNGASCVKANSNLSRLDLRRSARVCSHSCMMRTVIHMRNLYSHCILCIVIVCFV